MRILVTSDLHYDLAGHLTAPDTVEALARRMARERPDLLVLAGDLGHGLDNFRRCVTSFLGIAPTLAVIAGNHDVWRDEEHNLSSQSLWEDALPQACADLGAVWLEAQSLQLGAIGVVGSMAWYDYSAIDPEHQNHVSLLPSLKPMLNNDANWIDWPHKDPEVAARLGESLLQRIDLLEQDPSIQSIAVFTHVPLLEGQMVRKSNHPNWGLTNAFFGNLTLGNQILTRSKIRLIVSGHTHTARNGSLPRPSGDLQYSVIGSDYGTPTFQSFEIDG